MWISAKKAPICPGFPVNDAFNSDVWGCLVSV